MSKIESSSSIIHLIFVGESVIIYDQSPSVMLVNDYVNLLSLGS